MRSPVTYPDRTRTIALEPRDADGNSPQVEVPPDLMLFLHDRLCEEIIAATRRRETVPPDRAEAAERGLRMLDEIVLTIKRGGQLDRTCLRLLTLAYQCHPEFRPEWSADPESAPQ